MPLLDEQTRAKYGYNVADLNPGSASPVIYACDKCGAVLERQRRRASDSPLLCHHCKVAQPRPTQAIEKFKATMLARYGTEHALCNPEILAKMKAGVEEKYGVSNVTQIPEINDKRRGWWVRKNGPGSLEGLGVLSTETLQRYGVDPTALGAGSGQLVICRCSMCYQPFKRIFKHLRNPPLCHRCSFHVVPREHYAKGVKQRTLTILRLYGDQGIPPSTTIYGEAENKIATYIEDLLQEKVIRRKSLDGRKSLDIFIPSKQIGVEYCGLRWHNEHSPTPRLKWYHHSKMALAQAQGIRLITMFEDEWLNRQEPAKNVLEAILGVYSSRLGARDCTVTSLPLPEAHTFITQHHLIGNVVILQAWGLYHQDTLIAVLTLRLNHLRGGEGSVQLNRLCFARGVHIAGGASRLIHPAKIWAKENGYTRIVSWSDNRWSNGALYNHLGFQLTRDGDPDYQYVSIQNPRERFSKESQKKTRTNCPPDVTEVEHAFNRGLARIWDCGHKRWELEL